MVAVTFGGARVAAPAIAGAKPATESAKQGKGFFMRLFNAICDAQMKKAEYHLAQHRHLLPPDFRLERKAWSRMPGKEDEPFGGW